MVGILVFKLVFLILNFCYFFEVFRIKSLLLHHLHLHLPHLHHHRLHHFLIIQAQIIIITIQISYLNFHSLLQSFCYFYLCLCLLIIPLTLTLNLLHLLNLNLQMTTKLNQFNLHFPLNFLIHFLIINFINQNLIL